MWNGITNAANGALNFVENAFAQSNPLTNQTLQNSAANALPSNMWQGNPIRNALSDVARPAFAQVGNATQPNPKKTTTPTTPPQNPPPTPPGGGPTYPTPNPTQDTTQTTQTGTDPYAALKSSIGSGWDSYLNSLGGVGDYLTQQQNAQNSIADTQLQAGQNAINSQKANSLRDIAATTRNAFQAGNNYLGSLGAGDSSAANQYAFAINKQAGRQTGDLNNFVNSQLNQLQSTHDTQIGSIANWFGQQQAALKQAIANGQLNKQQDINNLSTSLLNQAIAATNAVKQNSQNQYNALLQWAANNSGNFSQLQQNIASIPQAMGSINLQNGSAGGPVYAPSSTDKYFPGVATDIFGNRLQ